jgi:beta-galactosidase/beta-glucuronidase
MTRFRLRLLTPALLLAALSTTAPARAQTAPASPGRVDNLDAYIEDPTVYARGQERAHTPRTVPYATVAAARAANEPGTELEARWRPSPYFKLLNGTWQFSFYERPAAVPSGGYAETAWESIRVPRSWQTAGYDQLTYINKGLTWQAVEQATDTDPPEAPDDYNPVGVYRRSFDVAPDWEGRRTFLHFEGVKQAYFVWVNGAYVGYDQGSATPAEFDVTDLLDYGSDNRITVQVYRFSDGEALETQDAVRFSGIRRSVYFFSKPPAHVRDGVVETTLGEEHETGTLTAQAVVANDGSDDGTFTVAGRLFGPRGQRVTTRSAPVTVAAGQEETVTLRAAVDDPALWSAEQPTLYELGLTLTPQGADAPAEAMVESVGFREYEVAGGQFRVNGEPINVHGVNRPEHSPRYGRHVPFETLLKDVEMMKRNNIDAVRAAHYPNDPSMYALADEYGIYVQDEVNVETHWNTDLVDEQPAYHDQMVERFRRMVRRDRNRPSVFMWSTGNEAGLGPAHHRMAAFAQWASPSQVLYHQRFDGTAPYSPLDGERYPAISKLRAMAGTIKKPLIMGEYRHAFGNGMGGFGTFWEMIQPPTPMPPDSLAQLQGGFVWDWANQSVIRPDGQPPAHWAGVLDGIVQGDRTPTPELETVKAAHEPFAGRGVNLTAGRVQIGNQYDVTNLAEHAVHWTLSNDRGETLQSGTLEGLDLPPGEWADVTIPFEPPAAPEPGAEYGLRVELRLAEDTPYAEAGHVVGAERLAVPFDAPPAPTVRAAELPPVERVTSEDGTTTITGEGFEYTFDRERGTFSSLVYDGEEVLTGGPRLTLWRAPTLSDGVGFRSGPTFAKGWRAAGLNRLTHEVQSVDVTETDAGSARIVVEGTAVSGDTARAEVTYAYTVLGSGDVRVAVEMRPTPALRSAVTSLPRIGVELETPTAMNRVRWYGRGPGGSFPDREAGRPPGVYEGRVAGDFMPVPPQAHGIKTDTRWAALTGIGGDAGLAVFADSTLAFSTSRFENLAAATYRSELRAGDALTVTLDHALMGVSTKFHPPPAAMQVPPQPTRFQFVLRPFDASQEDPAALGRRSFADPSALSR